MSINMCVQSVLDSIESAQKSLIIPDQEFILQGKLNIFLICTNQIDFSIY